ncbi:DUF2784 domain-containing protein [bacterium]|nr:DUF2784 domain-containing protein [bacterium]MBU1652842.1 DUF2784 domain-containing protein [bacterium]MBU1881947.1 DUF2784 domain-containing protein [bacterium]
MMNSILADLLLVIHFLFILFIIFGGLLVWKRSWIALLHIPAVLWGGYIDISGGICPLTPLEVQYRIASGQEGYAVSFLEHYLEPVVYLGGSARETVIFLGIAVVVWNLVLYLRLIRRFRSRKGAS